MMIDQAAVKPSAAPIRPRLHKKSSRFKAIRMLLVSIVFATILGLWRMFATADLFEAEVDSAPVVFPSHAAPLPTLAALEVPQVIVMDTPSGSQAVTQPGVSPRKVSAPVVEVMQTRKPVVVEMGASQPESAAVDEGPRRAPAAKSRSSK